MSLKSGFESRESRSLTKHNTNFVLLELVAGASCKQVIRGAPVPLSLTSYFPSPISHLLPPLTADQGCVWLVGRRSVCGRRLTLRPISCTRALSVTWTAPLQLRYAACGAIQVLYAFSRPPSFLLSLSLPSLPLSWEAGLLIADRGSGLWAAL